MTIYSNVQGGMWFNALCLYAYNNVILAMIGSARCQLTYNGSNKFTLKIS